MNTSQSINHNVSRRTILKGLGAALTLPWMESLAWASGGKSAVTAGPPRRWAAMIFTNGVWEPDWWAKGAGNAMELGPTLQPLARHKNNILVLNGLHIMPEFTGTVGGPHTPKFTNFLSGGVINRTNVPDLAESIDQRLAREIGLKTPLPTLTLGIEPTQSGLTAGVPSIYFTTISWSSDKTPVAPEIYPRRAFDRLFDTTSLLNDRSVLDAALDQSKSVRRKLSYHDKDKLDQYMESIRSVERRLELATSDNRFEGWKPTLDTPNIERPREGLDWDVPEHMRLMADLLVLAFQMDKTRIATLLLERDVSTINFNFLEGVGSGQYHATYSHHAHNPESVAGYKRINRYHTEMAAYVIDKMSAVDEGNGSLLDNSMLLFGSNLMDGNAHDATKLPLILAGGRNCEIKPGRVIDYTRPEDRLICNLHLATAQRMGLETDSFGNSTYPLPGLAG